MTDALPESSASELPPLPAAIADLKAGGAERFDPVRFRYLTAMSRRARALPEPAATLVADKARAALHGFRSDFRRARERAAGALEQLARHDPDSREALEELLQMGDFRALHRAAAKLERATGGTTPAELTRLLAAGPAEQSAQGSLASAMREQERAATGASAAGGHANSGEAPELKSLAPLRETLAALTTGQLLAREQQRASADSGPLNPQMLALRSLASMRELSPAYLDRFVSYLDALFWLDKAAAGYSPPKP